MQNNIIDVAKTLQKISLVILSIAFLVFPLIFSTLTTDAFALPKQVILALAVCLVLVLYGLQMVLEKKLQFRTTPLDLPIFILTLVIFVSCLFATNRFDSYIALFPFLFAVISYFAITNIVRSEKEVLFVVSALVGGALLSGLISALSFFKIYLIPMASAHIPAFTTFGSLLDQATYLIIVLPLAVYLALPVFQKHTKHNLLAETSSPADRISTGYVFAGAGLLLTICLGITVFQLFTTQKPLILPFSVGFQTAFAAVSQETNVFKGFLLGSGFGTYLTDFSRFKPVSFNMNQMLWTYTFFRSTSFFLELMATTGFLGVLSFLFLIFRIARLKILFLPVVIALVAAFLLPFSPVIYSLLFIILAVFCSLYSLHNPKLFPELEFNFVALKHGFLTTTPESEHLRSENGLNRFLPLAAFVIIIIAVGVLGYFSYKYVLSDYLFQKSLIAAAQNNGQATYSLESSAIAVFPYRDSFYRIFSQTNLALANSLAASQPKNSQPNTQVQQNILTLIQQSINAGRTAVTISPNTALNWNNLSQIYRSLIGFGQNADSFSIVTNQQAIALDPNNPQQYINLGGIYYQLSQWDKAQEQFTRAIQLKQDYANAYYNLGHVFESKNDLTDAMQAYGYVQQLVANDPTSKNKIDGEVKAIKDKIASQSKTANNQQAAVPTPPAENTAASQQPIGVNNSATQLPERHPKATIPGPTVSITPTQTTPTPGGTEGGVSPSVTP